MNAAEKIEAATAKLEALRAASTQPTDGTAWIQGRDRSWSENPNEVYTGPDCNNPLSQDIVHGLPESEDAELICTLHRTIDAQLAILRDTHRIATHRYAALFAFPYTTSDRNAVALADAILGGVS